MTLAPAVDVFGRDAELEAVRAFVESDAGGRSLLVLEGEPGIGKSTLWQVGIERARALGRTVLTARPTEAERSLGHVGLSDLLERHLDDVLAELAPPRRRALAVALLKADPPETPVDRRTIAVAVRDALELLAARGPILIAIDDVQWLDPSTSETLAFALRRLERSPVRVLLGRRPGGASKSALEGTVADRTTLALGPLSTGALHRCLVDRTGRALPRQTLLRLHEQSRGNPFVAIEMARALPERLLPLEPLPVPAVIEELVAGRLEEMPRATQAALGVAATAGSPTDALLASAGIQPDAIDPAVRAGVVHRANGALRFTHPLLASVAYARLGDERRGVHARLAGLVGDPILAARHLALSIAAADAHVAQQLEDAAELASGRGAAEVGAELAEEAFRLTPSGDEADRRRRGMAAARAHQAAGEWTVARALATELLGSLPSGRPRAECLLLLAEFEHDELAGPTLESALEHAGTDTALAALVHVRLAWARRFSRGFPAALEATRHALELATEAGDDAACFEALLHLHTFSLQVGDGMTGEYAARARDVASRLPDRRRRTTASLLHGRSEIDPPDIDGQRSVLEAAIAEWQDRDELFACTIRCELSWLEFRAGRWALAAELADLAHDISVQYGLEQNQDYIPIAWIAAHRGDDRRALAAADRGLELCESQVGFHPPLLRAVAGLVALGRGDPATAVVHLGDADGTARTLGWAAPDARWWTPDYLEALVQLDRSAEAEELLDEWQASSDRLSNEGAVAAAWRCRGLIAAARGAVDDAVSLLQEAVRRHAEAADPYGLARAQLALGIVLRRSRQRRAAREALVLAASGFEELGALAWLARARGELGRIGGWTTIPGLSPAEQRVALLVAEGQTNHEVATALFLAERTVASHLTKVYAKLGVRSRTELARKIQTF